MQQRPIDMLGLGVWEPTRHKGSVQQTSASFWRPSSLPALERRIAFSPLAWPLRIGRLAWVALTTPLWFGAVSIDALLSQRTPDKQRTKLLSLSLEHNHKAWSFRRRLCLPLLARVIWAVAGMGLPPRLLASAWYEEGIPLHAKLFERLQDYEIEKLKIPPVGDEWLLPDAKDPLGRIHPRHVPAFWIRAKGKEAAKDGADVVLLLSGGGYTMGHPLESDRALQIARRTGIPVLGVSTRKATLEEGAYPAALQDALSAYSHLMSLGYQRIALVGDSAGGGLSLTLLFHLAALAKQRAVLPPSRVVLYSPWVDLTVSSKSTSRNISTDTITPSMLVCCAEAYTRHLRPADGAEAGSQQQLGRAHPSLSPALEGGKQLFEQVKTTFPTAPNFLVIWGGLELLDDEITALTRHIEAAGLPLQTLRDPDEVHVFPLLGWPFAGEGRDRALNRVEDFLRR